MRIADVLDILVISVILYFCILWVRQRSSRSVIVGVSLIAALYVGARVLNMHLTSLLFQVGFTALMVAVVVVFQVDIRRIFERLTARRVFRSAAPATPASQTVDILVETAFAMASARTGALIAIKGQEPLDLHTRAGTPLDGLINMPLLLSIFSTDTPGHDGAVLIEENRIKGFGIYLPLSTKVTRVGATGGTRHAAALGLAERSDALVIVVSEERGVVSIAHQGQLYSLRSPDQLRRALTDFYAGTVISESAHRFHFVTENLGMKAASVAAAVILWFSLAYRSETISRSFVLPVRYRDLPAEWVIDEFQPESVRVSLSGIQRSFDIDRRTLKVVLDLSTLVQGLQSVQILESSVIKPPGLTVEQISPATVNIGAYRTAQLSLPIEVPSTGQLPDGLTLSEMHTVPAHTTVLVRRSYKDSISSLRTTPVAMDALANDTVFFTDLVLPSYCTLPTETAPSVRVYVDVEKK